MDIKDIFKLPTSNDVIAELKKHRFIPQPDVESAEKALDPSKHDINDPIKRKDKRVKVDADQEAESAQKVIDTTSGETSAFRTEKVARIALAIQRLIINRAVSFVFGNPPDYNATPANQLQETIVAALRKIFYDVKCNSINRKVARSVFSFKECAEHWYTVENKNTRYGFESAVKLRCAVYSPALGDELFPFFDESGDMVAFSRAFTRTNTENVSTHYFETFTNEAHWRWVDGANGYEPCAGFPKKNPINKIPIVWGHQSKFETQDVDSLVDRLELLLSNFADTNDYHASPKLFVTGQINGWSKKGEAGSVIEGEDGAKMEYVSWQNAPESVKLEIETLLKMIYTITQTPDISFDAVKGLNVSGVALKLLFMDAHLKVQDKREIFDEYLQRRVNIILAYIAQMNISLAEECNNIEIEPEIVPYMITSDIDELNYWLTANGNNPVISQEESVEKAGLSKDVKKTMQLLNDETSSRNSFVIGEPVNEDDA